MENFRTHWEAGKGDRKQQAELKKLIVGRVWVKNDQVVALSLRPNYHVSLGLESTKPTEIPVGSDFVQARERRGVVHYSVQTCICGSSSPSEMELGTVSVWMILLLACKIRPCYPWPHELRIR